jgi:hypothetical protein
VRAPEGAVEAEQRAEPGPRLRPVQGGDQGALGALRYEERLQIRGEFRERR